MCQDTSTVQRLGSDGTRDAIVVRHALEPAAALDQIVAEPPEAPKRAAITRSRITEDGSPNRSDVNSSQLTCRAFERILIRSRNGPEMRPLLRTTADEERYNMFRECCSSHMGRDNAKPTVPCHSLKVAFEAKADLRLRAIRWTTAGSEQGPGTFATGLLRRASGSHLRTHLGLGHYVRSGS